jgi:electron transfer flavoprotein alpha/beta subunit
MWRVAIILGSNQDAGDGALPALPKSDRAAVGLAVKRFVGGSVHAYCLGDDDTALRYALAAGASTAVPLGDVAEVDADVILVGNGGAGRWGDLLPALLAEHKRCAMLVDVLDVEVRPDRIAVTRDLGRGSREVLGVSGAAVLGVSEAAVQLLYVSRYRRQAASVSRSAQRVGLTYDPLAEVSGTWVPTRPRVKVRELAVKTGGSASGRLQALMGLAGGRAGNADREHVIRADAATCAQHLLRFLRHHGVIAGVEMAPVKQHGPEMEEDRASQETGSLTPATRSRAPRPLGGEATGRSRRPRPLQSEVAPSSLAPSEARPRGPRPIGQNAPRQRRAPRPV